MIIIKPARSMLVFGLTEVNQTFKMDQPVSLAYPHQQEPPGGVVDGKKVSGSVCVFIHHWIFDPMTRGGCSSTLGGGAIHGSVQRSRVLCRRGRVQRDDDEGLVTLVQLVEQTNSDFACIFISFMRANDKLEETGEIIAILIGCRKSQTLTLVLL